MTRQDDRSTARVESFSDAIFGFSATLLVVSLEVPDSFGELLDDLSGFGAFAISFMALVLIWSVHRGFFRRYPLMDGWTLFINAVLLFVVLFYVYPLKYMSMGLAQFLFGIAPTGGSFLETIDQLATLYVLYGAGFLAIFLCISAMYFNAWRLTRRDAPSRPRTEQAIFLARHYALFSGVAVLSIVLSLADIGVVAGVPGFIYALMGPLAWSHGALTERAGRATILD